MTRSPETGTTLRVTTTLRPTGPERHGADGQRSRDYDVCVNSRPVGRIELSTDSWLGPGVGRIVSLHIEEADRRRGRGVLAALTAEEVLRGWGCGQVQVTVPAGAQAVLGLAEALGYTERNINMVKQVPDRPPSLPEGSEDRPMSEDEFTAWQRAGKQKYAQSLTDRGVTEEQAQSKSEADHAALLSDGLLTPGAVLRVLTHRGTETGTVWVSFTGVPDGLDAYVFDVEVAEEHRGHGHGRTLMLVAERECRAAGVDRLGLNVFAGNTPAIRLYASLGYRPIQRHLYKMLL
jgi:ribosomal protein S18 acetylase RimI-like enzyme